MKVRRKDTGEEFLVLAIMWPASAPRVGHLTNQTQLSGYDGFGLSEHYWEECEILEADITQFAVKQQSNNSEYCAILWKPLLDTKFWQAVREFDKSALDELKLLVESSPELMGEHVDSKVMLESACSISDELRILVCQAKSLSSEEVAQVLNLLNYEEVELAGETLVDAFARANSEIPAPLTHRLYNAMKALGAARYFNDHLTLPKL